MTLAHDDYGDGLLAPYRVLDLTDSRGLLCGKMLADMGADVVQVEPPSGSVIVRAPRQARRGPILIRLGSVSRRAGAVCTRGT